MKKTLILLLVFFFLLISTSNAQDPTQSDSNMLEGIKKFLNRAIERRKSYRQGRRGTVYEIVHDQKRMNVSWLTMENQRGHRILMWDDIISISAFKRDIYAVDLICLGIELRDGSAVEVDEEMAGWDSLVKKLPEYLPGCKTFGEWFEAVAFPAFKLNMTPIFQRRLEGTRH